MPKYKFTWEFDYDEFETPEQAVIEAWDALVDPESIARVLIMEEVGTDRRVKIDINQIDEDYGNSGRGVTPEDIIRKHIGDTFKK